MFARRQGTVFNSARKVLISQPCLTKNMHSKPRLEGKVAVVTASTEGIGFAIAKKLAQDGAKVVISSRKEENVLSAEAELKKHGLDITGTVCHVGKAEDRKKLLDKEKRILLTYKYVMLFKLLANILFKII